MRGGSVQWRLLLLFTQPHVSSTATSALEGGESSGLHFICLQLILPTPHSSGQETAFHFGFFFVNPPFKIWDLSASLESLPSLENSLQTVWPTSADGFMLTITDMREREGEGDLDYFKMFPILHSLQCCNPVFHFFSVVST